MTVISRVPPGGSSGAGRLRPYSYPEAPSRETGIAEPLPCGRRSKAKLCKTAGRTIIGLRRPPPAGGADAAHGNDAAAKRRGDMAMSSAAFIKARDFLLGCREDYATAYRDFRWPELGQFNW
ncbi:MAG TPA: hypothetical protein VMU42_18350, partial [Candidatus Sulfotelmatobacter sp.]|nr:hypothetical protein [Candidatus Sulfotelmatobacter sp.]